MATETATPPVTQDEGSAAEHLSKRERKRAAKELKRAKEERKRAEEERKRAEERRTLRERQLENALQDLDVRHQGERRALTQELFELADARKAIQDQLWANWISSFPDLEQGRHDLTAEQQPKLSAEDGASCSSSVPSNGKEGPGEGDEENPIRGVISVLKARQREKEKQTQLKELLPAKDELHVEAQLLLQALDKEVFRKAYEHRITVEDPREIKAHQQTVAAKQARLWRFVSKKVEAKSSAKGDIDYVDEQKLGYPKLPGCYEEIKKLWDIEKNPIFNATLKEWNRKEELYNRRVECKKHRVANLKNEVYQLIGFFSVFQGVVLTAVSQSSFLYCRNKWSPIALSVLASVISTLAVLQKLYQINDLQTNIESEERHYKTAVQVGTRIRDIKQTSVQVGNPLREIKQTSVEVENPVREREPEGIDFVQLNAKIESITNPKPKLLERKHLSWLYFVAVTLTLVAFGVLFPVSFWSILCKPGSPPAQ